MLRKMEPYDRINCILETVGALEEEYPTDGVPLEQIVDVVTAEGFDRDEVIQDIENLERYVGHLDSPEPNRYHRCQNQIS